MNISDSPDVRRPHQERVDLRDRRGDLLVRVFPPEAEDQLPGERDLQADVRTTFRRKPQIKPQPVVRRESRQPRI